MMLSLKAQECTVQHVNFRTEKHGEDDVTAVDVKLTANMPPSVLEMLVPGMVEHFFKEANSSGAMKGEKALRFPDLVNMFRVDGDFPGYKIAFEWGVSGTLLEFADIEIGKILVELIEGGAVTLTFRAQVSGDPNDLAKLVPLISLKLPVTLTPPPATELPKDHPDAKGKTKKTDKPAGDTFAGTDLAAKAPATVQ